MHESEVNAMGEQEIPAYWKEICEFMAPKFRQIVVEGTPTALWDKPEPSKPTWGVQEAYLLSFQLRLYLARMMQHYHGDDALIGGQGYRQLEVNEEVQEGWVPQGTEQHVIQTQWGSVSPPIFCARLMVGMTRMQACAVQYKPPDENVLPCSLQVV